MSAAKLRLLIADDQPLMRAGFRAVLEAQGDMEVVGEAGDGAAAVEMARRLSPDIVLMDIRMPVLDGIEATRRLTGHRVLILTTFGLDDYIIEALRAGASGFILKDVPTEELVHAVRVIAAGEALLSRPSRGGCSTASAAASGERDDRAGGLRRADRSRTRGLRAARARPQQRGDRGAPRRRRRDR